jgi:hypothetical protein
MLTTWLVVWTLGGASPAFPPLRPDSTDAQLRRLQAEAVAARREQVELLLKAVQDSKSFSFAETGTAVRQLADAEAELSGDPAAGVKWAERWRQVLADRMKQEEEQLRRGSTGPSHALQMLAAFTDAEIDLLRRREAVKGGPAVTPEEKLSLYTKRVKLLTAWEGLVAKTVAVGVTTRADLLPVTVARAEAEIELVKLKEAIEKKGK